MTQVDLKTIRSKAILNISHEAARACEMSYTELRGLICGYYYPTDRQLIALMRYFHLEERA